MTSKERKEQITRLCEALGCYPRHLAGLTFEQLLDEAEANGFFVYWGSWSRNDFDTVLVPIYQPEG